LRPSLTWLAALAAGCAGGGPAAPNDFAVADFAVAAVDASARDLAVAADMTGWCEWAGAPGTCMTAPACNAIADHAAEPGNCAGGLSCCIDAPDVADNPPVPAGWKLMMQSQVTPAMTTWAVAILHDPLTYPMFSTTMMTFGTQLVMARVEWHPPDFQNNTIHRGVTLYIPA